MFPVVYTLGIIQKYRVINESRSTIVFVDVFFSVEKKRIRTIFEIEMCLNILLIYFRYLTTQVIAPMVVFRFFFFCVCFANCVALHMSQKK